ncbi:uncharacterized protein [Rutidosis leptorrhynchoides]|uniref:uncharacterized protein n=1 Tax=Rutidosis leptorrhynchoides TaxID=125765 RepID=UPI003A9A0FFE
MFLSGMSMPRGSSTMLGDVPPITQCLVLDPIVIGEQKYTRSGELRRALGISGGSTAEDSFFKSANARPPPPSTEEIKRFKASVLDSSDKARGRAKKLVDSIRKLNKYSEALNSKKLHQSGVMTNEKISGSNLFKNGNLMQQTPSDLGLQKLEERTKGVVLNKRVRTSVAEIRAEGQSNTLTRLPVAMGKEKDMPKDGGESSDLVDEKTRRLPVGGEGWDKKMKRKRSVGTTAFARNVDAEGDLKRVVHPKVNNEPVLHSSDTQILRSGLSNGNGCTTKADITFPPASLNARLIPKNDMEKVPFSRDFVSESTKDRPVAKGNNRLSIREENHNVSSSPLIKGKASRGPRTGNSLAVVNNRKRQLPAGSSSPPPITQWGGQRPQKMSRTRRANMVSPVTNHDEMQTSPDGGASADLGARMASVRTNGLLLARGIASSNQQIRVRHEHASPARLSESEESGAGEICENRFREKGPSSNEVEQRGVGVLPDVSSPLLLTKKKKLLNKEETGDGVRRQGSSGRGLSFPKNSISPIREKFDDATSTKLVKSTRSGSDKNGSKTGRPPLKKFSERKAARPPISGSPEFLDESVDDREELLAAANLFHEASSPIAVHTYSSPFWKKMEPVFASVSSEDRLYLNQQLKSTEELNESLSQMHGCGSDNLVELLHEDLPSKRKMPKEHLTTPEINAIPLFQRVLSALITEDEIEDGIGGGSTYQNSVSTYLPDVEPINRDSRGVLYEPLSGSRKQCATDRFPCNGFMHSENGMIHELYANGGDGTMSAHTKTSNLSFIDCRYEQMNLEGKLLLELQSIGLYPEAMPDLDDGEEDALVQEINKMQKGLQQQLTKKKEHLNKLVKAIENLGEVEGRNLEQVAMDKLVELSYKKLLATKGTSAAKLGVPKISKQAALGFARRTLGRCRQFEDTGKSCFSESGLRDVLSAAPSRGNDAVIVSVHPEAGRSHPEPVTPGVKAGKLESGSSFDVFETLTHTSDQDFAKTGPILNRGKKKEVLLDDVGATASLRATSSALGMIGGAKGKRSERERDKDMMVARNSKGERKTKPKQKTVQLSTSSVNELLYRPAQTSPAYSSPDSVSADLKNKKNSHGNTSLVDSFNETKETKDVFPSNELESIELGEGNELGEHQDFNNWFNFDEDNLQDHDLVGLQIPMDDLTELNMF